MNWITENIELSESSLNMSSVKLNLFQAYSNPDSNSTLINLYLNVSENHTNTQ